jgi:hypothetical protein
MFRLARAALVLAAASFCAACASVSAHDAPPSSLVSVDVYDRHDGASLPVYAKDGRRYVVGTPGHEYAVRIRNQSGERILAVTSVDGVNVISGETASPRQSGYVIGPWESVEIAGWRKSLARTAAFYFTDLGDSYAARTGRPDNVGVIGVAVFREQRPPVAYVPPRQRFADADQPGKAAAGAAAETPPAPAAAPRAESAAEGAERTLASKIGTGHGRSETSYAQQVSFRRASEAPAEIVTIQYDRRENLAALGVLPPPRFVLRTPDAFPDRFVPDPR